jgi:hypothetical protein
MSDVNHVQSIVKVLEIPTRGFFINDILMTKVRCQLPQYQNTIIVDLIFWGKLAADILAFYKVNDYILIEGYLGLLVDRQSKSKKFEITVLKIYPLVSDFKE